MNTSLTTKALKHFRKGTFPRVSLRWLKYHFCYTNEGDARRPARLLVYMQDLKNKLHYGVYAPRFAESITIAPSKCFMSNMQFKCWQINSGQVINVWPYGNNDLIPVRDIATAAIESDEVGIVRSCLDHWVNGVPWRETWNYKRIEHVLSVRGRFPANQLANLADLDRRYACLDRIFEQIKQDARLRPRSEVSPRAFREEDSALVHVGPNGELVVAGLGLHRFAMALALGLPSMPAQIGCVHVDALDSFKALRCGT